MSPADGASTLVHGTLEAIYARALRPYDGELSAPLLMSEAEQVTGLADWGGARWSEDGFRFRFNALCEALETEAELTLGGRSRAHSRVHTMLCSRLRVVAYHKGLATEPVLAPPLVGTGLARSGTSFMQQLLAQDPDSLVPLTGEAMIPVPPPGVLADEAERLKLVSRLLEFQGLDAPAVNAVHPFAPDATDEDVVFQEAACGSAFLGFFAVPGFASAYAAGTSDMYQWQKGMMQLVQGNQTQKRWVLKAPEHMSDFDSLRLAFPNAMVFVNHRDPSKVVASTASLYVTFRSLNTDTALNPRDLGAPILASLLSSIDRMMQWRARNPQVTMVDVHYKSLIANPVGEAERVYDAFGLKLSAETKQNMERFLKVNRHGQSQQGVTHRYNLEDFGLTKAAVLEACGQYMEQYQVDREN